VFIGSLSPCTYKQGERGRTRDKPRRAHRTEVSLAEDITDGDMCDAEIIILFFTIESFRQKSESSSYEKSL
jgi:hypothetical protein